MQDIFRSQCNIFCLYVGSSRKNALVQSLVFWVYFKSVFIYHVYKLHHQVSRVNCLQYRKFTLQHTDSYPTQHQWVKTQSFGGSDCLWMLHDWLRLTSYSFYSHFTHYNSCYDAGGCCNMNFQYCISHYVCHHPLCNLALYLDNKSCLSLILLQLTTSCLATVQSASEHRTFPFNCCQINHLLPLTLGPAVFNHAHFLHQVPQF